MNPESYLKASARPDLALHDWERLRTHLDGGTLDADDPAARCLLSLLGNSPVATRHLLKDPERRIRLLLESDYIEGAKPRETMLREIQSLYETEFGGDLISVQRLLRGYKYQETARIAGRDLSGLAAFEDVGSELAALASASTEIAVRAAGELLADRWEGSGGPPPFVVMGLGKLGGGDLNFSSDIDVLYVHASSRAPADLSRSVFEYFCRVSETVTKILHERTDDGIVFRVDLDLRPEGKSGVIVNSLEALVSYYEASGAPWERGALIKARPVAGNSDLGLRILEQLDPFVFPKLIDDDAIRHLKEMKSKINAELRRSAPHGGYHLKLGVGGIREIEFFATAFQLIYGGKETRLRERNTLKALEALRDLGLVPAEHCEHLRSAYVFLRRAENRLQMEEERQVHALPKDKDHLEALARRCGAADVEVFLKELEGHTKRVADYFKNLAS